MTPFIAIAPRSTLVQSGRTWYGLNRTKLWFLKFTVFCIQTVYLCLTELFKIELFWNLNCVLMLNWIVQNRTILTSKLHTYAKLNYLKYNCFDINSVYCPVSWGCRIHRLHLCNPGYDTKQSDGEVPVMLGLWGMQSTPSLPLVLGPLWPRMVAPDRALSMS